MKQALFYIVNKQDEPDSMNPAHFTFACQQIAALYRQGKRIQVWTSSQEDACLVDEILWTFESDSFIPHNLENEGPRYGAPVEIAWTQTKSKREILVNLAENAPAFASNYKQIIDFVPTQEALKQLARERFKHYRGLGYTMQTIDTE
ncbi:DNA polymerase III subunit chi [Algicola sagamiensis]|uniref:DNA polymerase III subunit chi n=1 Tax=Algicola sagamiensis TaxID=163869 RepID=UPI00035E8AA8|nr:DNA polymerase III subunit chi [Algicola sagamiensis]